MSERDEPRTLRYLMDAATRQTTLNFYDSGFLGDDWFSLDVSEKDGVSGASLERIVDEHDEEGIRAFNMEFAVPLRGQITFWIQSLERQFNSLKLLVKGGPYSKTDQEYQQLVRQGHEENLVTTDDYNRVEIAAKAFRELLSYYDSGTPATFFINSGSMTEKTPNGHIYRIPRKGARVITLPKPRP